VRQHDGHSNPSAQAALISSSLGDRGGSSTGMNPVILTRNSTMIGQPAQTNPPSPRAATVIGAGIVGACIALSLQRAGVQVTLLDAMPPGSLASYGNAGLISVESCIPISLPGMFWQTPRWLLDPDGPLAVRPAYLLRALPWLIKWLQAGGRDRALSASVALHALHRPALSEYRTLLGQDAFDDLIHVNGQLHVWSHDTAKPGRATDADRLVDEMRRTQGILTETLTATQIDAAIPGLAAHVNHGIRFPTHAHTINPKRLVATLTQQLIEAGGELRCERVDRIAPRADGDFDLHRAAGVTVAPCVIVAAGAQTKAMLTTLGVHLPLEFERGYHVEFPRAGVNVSQPFIYKNKAVAVTPMENGLRFAGTVEFAGLDAPADPRRTDALIRIARELFPDICIDDARSWLGFRPSTPDSVPVIDQLPAHGQLFVACGHGHTGMTGAPMTAQLIQHLVTGCAAAIDPTPYRLARFA
jgi:D-amino-acid dehydrogenase